MQPEHQRADWKAVHKLVCSASKSRQLAPPLSAVDEARTRAKWSLPEYEMVIEDEPEPLPLTADERKRLAEYNARSEEDLSEMDQRDIEVRHFPHSSPRPDRQPWPERRRVIAVYADASVLGAGLGGWASRR